MADWYAMPRIFPHIKAWGCTRGPWNYVLSHNAVRNDWGVSAKLANCPAQQVRLGFRFATRADAEAAVEQHYQRAVHMTEIGYDRTIPTLKGR